MALASRLILHSSGSDGQNSRCSLCRRPRRSRPIRSWEQKRGSGGPDPFPDSHLWMAAPHTDDTAAKGPVPNTENLRCPQAGGHRTREASLARSAPRVAQPSSRGTDQRQQINT